MGIDLGQLKQILDLVRTHGLSELEVEFDGVRVKARTSTAASPIVVSAATPAVSSGPPRVAEVSESAPAPVSLAASTEEVELAVVKSPIVGTFYRSAEPEAPAFVEIGTTVKKGQVLCIIEAMKLMNEIDSEYEGEVVNVYVENGQPVQYGERLFAIKTG